MEPQTTAQQAIQKILECLRGRPIVPFLGAGISVSTGFPSIKLINQYLAKVDFAIQKGVYQDRYPSLKSKPQYKDHPSYFLIDFGWPDPGQLDADLWKWLIAKRKETGGHLERTLDDADPVDKTVACRLPQTTPDRDRLSLDLCRKLEPRVSEEPRVLLDNPSCLDFRHQLDAIVQYQLREDLQRLESGGDDAAFLHWWNWKRWYFGGTSTVSRFPSTGDKQPDLAPELLYGNWESLLDHLCEGSLDLSDQLFTQLELGRSPSLAHRYLVFLREKVSMPLILTTNFDSLLEQAFRDHGVDGKVFDVHRDAAFPDRALIQRQFSIIKLHGSAYGLRLGERLKYPLDPTAREQVLACIPPNALILVLGFSGSERRMVQLLHALGTQPRTGRRDQLDVIWLWKGDPTAWAKELARDHQEQIILASINDANTFLQELYYSFSDGYPAGRVPYPAIQSGSGFTSKMCGDSTWKHESPPTCVTTENKTGYFNEEEFHRRARMRQPVHVFIPSSLAQGRYKRSRKKDYGTAWSTLTAAAFVNQLDYGYRTIWIDLENHHTVAGIAAEIFAKARVFDPHAPQAPLADAEGALGKIVERIQEVFQRGRYVVVLDSLECFGRSQMMHHGLPSYEVFESALLENHLDQTHPAQQTFASLRQRLETRFDKRVKELKEFLKKLMHVEDSVEPSRDNAERFYCDSYLCITIGGPAQSRFEQAKKPAPLTPSTIQNINDLIASVLDPLQGTATCCSWGVLIEQQEDGYEEIKPQGDLYPRVKTDTHLQRHWRRDVALPPVARVRSQLQDVLALLRYLLLQPVTASFETLPLDHKVLMNEKAGLLALMSVIRRPRTVPLIRSLTERWVIRLASKSGDWTLLLPDRTNPREISVNVNKEMHKQVDKLVGLLTGILRSDDPQGGNQLGTETHPYPVVGRWESGGSLWLFREIHESVYATLSDQLSARKWIAAWREDPDNIPKDLSPAATILSGLMAITWHWAAARSFYADVYRSTRDVHAFYEYLYHRMSALRIMTLLLVVLEVHQDAIEELQAVLSKDSNHLDLPDLLKILGVFDPLGEPAEESKKKTPTSNDKLRGDLKERLDKLRSHGLETLERALQRNRDRLRRTATPQTLEAWVGQFCDREIYDLNGKVFWLSTIDSAEAEKRRGSRTSVENLDHACERLEQQFRNLLRSAVSAQMQYRRDLVDQLNLSPLPSGSLALSTEPQQSELEAALGSMVIKAAHDFSASCDSTKNASTPHDLTSQFYHLKTWVRAGMDLGLCESKLNDALESSITAAKKAAKGEYLQELHELKTKHGFRELLLWDSLIHRQVNDNSDERVRNKPLEERLKNEVVLGLESCETASKLYENELRATAESASADVRHRSSALTLRARSLYLRGKFRQGHRWLDLAAASANPTVAVEQVSMAVVHLHRAELLALSADEHYRAKLLAVDPILPVKIEELLSEVAVQLQKLERASRELHVAADAIRDACHLTPLRVRVDLGAAVVKLETLLFRMEHDFWEFQQQQPRPRNVPSGQRHREREHARRSGELEQGVLGVMQSLRSVLDNLPLENDTWETIHNKGRIKEPLILTELQVYALWQQLFVLAMHYSALLHDMASGTFDVDVISSHVQPTSPSVKEARNRWIKWAHSMRFEKLSEGFPEYESSSSVIDDGKNSLTPAGYRARTLMVMQSAGKLESLVKVWNLRRKSNAT